MNNSLEKKFQQAGITLSDKQVKQFETYYELLDEWNKVMNLTTIIEYEEVIDKHFIDSIEVKNVIDISSIKKVIDIGTGAGFPGIPLKIMYPHLNITLLDSVNKKIKFLNEVVQRLELEGVHTLHGRAEDFAKEEGFRECFDLCVSRAVANLATLSEYCIPYIQLGGTFISYKSGGVEAEVEEAKKAIHTLGGELDDITKFQLPNTDIERSLVQIKKISNTAKKYPRKAGLPSKEPI